MNAFLVCGGMWPWLFDGYAQGKLQRVFTRKEESMEKEKKQYTSPRLVIHGDVERITLNASSQNRDSPTGINNTAYPNLT